ncbi:hypothetical protein CMI37_15755 [Candidatus Pacearchaeota archaeon]|nr:hypothetical protein [Candidatus Pacearchaeota archaeon]
MSFTLAGFLEDIDAGGAVVNLTALPDAHLFAQGDNLRVPELNQILGVFAGLGAGGAGLARLESPTLRNINRLVVSPVNHLADSDAEPSDPPAVMDMRRNPRILTVDEILQAVIDTNTSAAADQWVMVLLGDGSPTPPNGEIINVRATSATTATARVWSTTVLTFADVLPEGRYQVVGLRAVGATMIAARFVFKPGLWRPGCIGGDAQQTTDHPMFRNGGMGIWGEFSQTTPPDIEVLCDAADTAQTYDIDLIKVG